MSRSCGEPGCGCMGSDKSMKDKFREMDEWMIRQSMFIVKFYEEVKKGLAEAKMARGCQCKNKKGKICGSRAK
jgi:hypothetical protein